MPQWIARVRRLIWVIAQPNISALQCAQCGEIWPEGTSFSPGKPIATLFTGRPGRPPQCLVCTGRVLVKVRVRQSLIQRLEAGR